MIVPDTSPTLLGVDVFLVGTIVACVAAAVVFIFINAAITINDPMVKRLKSLNSRRAELKTGMITGKSKKRQSLVRRTDTTDRMKEAMEGMKVLQESQVKVIQQKLAQAGFRNKELAVVVLFSRMVLPVVMGLIGVVLFYWSDMFPDWGSTKRFMGFAASLVLGYKGPEIYLKNISTKRTKEIQKGLPDALDLLVICAEAGLTVDAAFNRVAKELGRAYPELGDEFALTAIELSFLTERRQAFENLAYRVDLDAVRGVVTTMIQTERYGTPLASALRVLSAEFRNERMMRAEEKAARLPAIMTVPLILFILPVLFVVILGPAACSISDGFINK